MGSRISEQAIENIRHLYADLEYSTNMIQDLTGISSGTVRRYMKQFGVMRNLSISRKNAIKNGRLFPGSKPGNKSPAWKSGVCFSGGYIKILVSKDDPFYSMAERKDKYIREHRLVIAKHLGRCLTKDEIVHHLNGIKTDNRLVNLAVVSCNNHPTNTFTKLLQKRIRELEAELSQQKLI